MKVSVSSKFAALLVGASMLAGIPSAASAYTVHFGEDLNNSSSTPLASTPNASAAEASFLTFLTGVGTENFESFASGTGQPLALVFPGAGTATLTGGNGAVSSVTAGTTNGAGRYGTSGTNFWEVSAGGTGNFVVSFSAPVAAFGFYGVDIGDFGGQLQLQLDDTANTLLTVNNTIGSGGSTDGSVLFYGFIASNASEQFSTISFETSTGTGDVFAFDDMTAGSLQQAAIPVPAAGLMAATAFGLMALQARRRNKA